MIEFQKNFSKNLKKYRSDNSLSQEIAAESLGISPVFLSELECCKKTPSCETLVRLYRQMGYDYIPLNTDSDNDNQEQLISIIKKHPEIAETLLDVAKNLI